MAGCVDDEVVYVLQVHGSVHRYDYLNNNAN